MNIAIVVPVLGRPHHAERFMSTLNASGATDCVVYPIASPGDDETIEAWRAAGASVMVSDRGGTFACKAQYGYLNTTESWILLIGSDVIFHPGWQQAAIAVADANPWAHMIATNDMGNPWVLAGQGATHPLIRRSWVDEVGASFDGPGHIAHEGYGHVCDPEWFACAAIRDKCFVYAPECRIEHMHPSWDQKGEMDEVYALGNKHWVADHRLWKQRGEKAGVL